jgi:hypothetical protein
MLGGFDTLFVGGRNKQRTKIKTAREIVREVVCMRKGLYNDVTVVSLAIVFCR